KVKQTRYYYDSLALGSANKGNLTKEENWKSGSSYINTQKTYNSFGLVTQSTDPRGKQTTFAYDTYNLYPPTTTNPLSHTTHHDYPPGRPPQPTDPNRAVSQLVYDGSGRTLQALNPAPPSTSTLATTTAYSYTDSPNAVSVHQTDYLSASTTVDTYSYQDGLG